MKNGPEAVRALVLTQASEILGGEEKAWQWLQKPNRVLGGKRPIELLDSADGAGQVEEALGRIEHGVYS